MWSCFSLTECISQILALKTVMFCFFGASACLLPYMTIHMRHLGITEEEIAIVYAILPFVQVIGSPLAGVIADRIGNYKPVLCIALITSILTSLAIMLIPSSGDPKQYQTEIEKSRHQMIFIIYMTIRIIFQLAIGICSTLLDATAIFLCEKYDTSFGKVRFWGILATGVFSPICGLLVDLLSHGRDQYSADYSPTFYFFNTFLFLTFMSSTVLDIQVSSSPKNLLPSVKPLLRSLPIWLLLTVVFALGTMWGFVESFLFLYLEDLKARKSLLGLTLTTGAIISLPFLFTSDWFVKKLGHANLMLLALIFYFIRFVGYSLIDSPYWCFPFEAMEVFTYHLMWVAATTYSAKLASKGTIGNLFQFLTINNLLLSFFFMCLALRATVISVVGTMHNGVGRAAGSMIGGTLMWLFNIRLAFRFIGYGAGVTAIFYFMSHHIYLRYHEDSTDQEKNTCNGSHKTSQSIDLEARSSSTGDALINGSNIEMNQLKENSTSLNVLSKSLS